MRASCMRTKKSLSLGQINSGKSADCHRRLKTLELNEFVELVRVVVYLLQRDAKEMHLINVSPNYPAVSSYNLETPS